MRGNRAHQWTLAFVAISATAEDHTEFAGHVRPHRIQNRFERIRRVRVVDKDGCAANRERYFFQSSRRTFDFRECRENALG